MARKDPATQDTGKTRTAAGVIDASEWEKGYRGVEVDKTPNEAYSVAGVTSSTTAAEADNAAEEGATPANPA
jgi:hypothetical protein